jgi:hypothetical protein
MEVLRGCKFGGGLRLGTLHDVTSGSTAIRHAGGYP